MQRGMAQVSVLRAGILSRNDADEAGDAFELLVRADPALKLILGEEALSPLAGA